MWRLRLVGLSALVVLLLAGQALAQGTTQQPPPNAYDARIRHLLEISGAKQQAYQGALGMIAQLKNAATSIPDTFWDEALDLIRSDLDQFIEALVPIYRSHFSAQEIEGLIKFYESPVGKRFVAEQAAIQQEAVVAGRKWGEQMAKVLVQRMQAKGFMDAQGNLIRPTPTPAPSATSTPGGGEQTQKPPAP